MNRGGGCGRLFVVLANIEDEVPGRVGRVDGQESEVSPWSVRIEESRC